MYVHGVNVFYILKAFFRWKNSAWLQWIDFHRAANEPITGVKHQPEADTTLPPPHTESTIERPHGSGSPSAAPIVAGLHKHRAGEQASRHRALFTATAREPHQRWRKAPQHQLEETLSFPPHWPQFTGDSQPFTFCHFTSRLVGLRSRKVACKSDKLTSHSENWPRFCCGSASVCGSVYSFAHRLNVGREVCTWKHIGGADVLFCDAFIESVWTHTFSA